MTLSPPLQTPSNSAILVMEVDEDSTKDKDSSKAGKGRIERRKASKRKSAIVFPKYNDRNKVRKSKAKN